jgi:hypothetical protein
MAKKKAGLDMSPEARAERTREKREEMERQGCPFGRYPDGTPRTRPEVPPELRAYYVVYGIRRATGERVAFKGFKSMRRAKTWIDDTFVLIKQSCESIEVVRSKLIEARKLD